jgi:NTE family protein
MMLLSGCATMIHNAPVNVPLAASGGDVVQTGRGRPANNGDFLIGLAFSGGGMRAAAFSFGVLSEFDRTQIRSRNTTASLLDRIDFLSGVSGGAITAAYFGLKGRAALSDFRERFLLRNAEESLATKFTPTNVFRAYEGGVNDAEQFPRWLDANLFHGATFRDLGEERRPRVWINASDIYNRTPFVFSDTTFGAICSDLASYPIASAVAASSAMPVIFAPIVLRTFPDRCAGKEPGWMERAQNNPGAPPILKESAAAIARYRDGSVPYIKLLDGGLVDNRIYHCTAVCRHALWSAGGATGRQYSPRDVSSRRRGRGPSGDWARTAEGPVALKSSWRPRTPQSTRACVRALRHLTALCPSGAIPLCIGAVACPPRKEPDTAQLADGTAGT